MPLSRWLLYAVSGGLLVLLLVTAPAAAQITTNTALPVTEGRGIVRAQSKVIRATGGGPMNRELTAFGFPLVGVYGVSPNWAVFGVVPILDKNLDVTTPRWKRTSSPP